MLKLRPRHVGAHNSRGIALAALRQLSAALDAYDLALAIQPDNAAVLNNLSVALSELGRFDEALQYVERALALQPRYADALYNRGNAYLALAATRRRARALPPSLSLSRCAPTSQQSRPSTDGAAEAGRGACELRQAIAIDPTNPRARHNRANALADGPV